MGNLLVIMDGEGLAKYRMVEVTGRPASRPARSVVISEASPRPLSLARGHRTHDKGALMEFAFGTGFANPGQTITPGNAKLHTPTTMALGRTAEDLGYDALWIWNRI